MSSDSGRRPNTENINEVILRILDIEDSDEIDYVTYKALLREAMQKARGVGNKMPSEEVEQLTNEWKRIKAKSGRFRVKETKIKSNKFFDKQQKNALYGTAAKKYLPVVKKTSPIGAIQKSFFASSNTISDSLKETNDILKRIYSNLLLQSKEEKKQEELERKNAENKARNLKESRLENVFKGLIKTAEFIIKPFKSILDQLFDYIFNILLGTTVLKLIDWFNNPDNQSKITSIQRFLSDHWPKLLGAYLLFGNKFGRFVTTIAGTLMKQLVRLAAANPLIAAGLAAAGLTAALAIEDRKRRDKEKEENQKRYAELITGKTEQGAIAPGAYGPTVKETPQIVPTKKNFFESFFSGSPTTSTGINAQVKNDGGIIQKIVNVNDISYEDGGPITGQSGIKISGAGPDTQLVAARPGEVVLTPEDTKKIKNITGFDVLGYVKNRRPKMAKNIQFANMGGVVGKVAEHLKKDEALSSLSKNVNDFIKPGGKSVMSGMNWSMLNPKTPIHSYVDSVGQPTIGWGSTFYDSILQGKKPVKVGDTITKNQADKILNANISNLSVTYSKKIPMWNKMSEDQKAGVLLIGYNAPYGPIGAYPKLTAALRSGDMVRSALNVDRGGPNKQRITLEKRLLMSGPKNLNIDLKGDKQKLQGPITSPAKTTKPQQKNILQKIGEGIKSFISSKPTAKMSSQTLASVPPPMTSPSVTTSVLPPISSPNQSSVPSRVKANVDVPDFSVISPSSRSFTSKVYFG
jgi:GH24 family phage-related lysozyme (muramidase)